MKRTLLLKVDSQTLDLRKVRVAADIIKKGGLVAFPTETVYGLGADALSPKAVINLFEAKQRPLDNPPIIHVGNPRDVSELVKEISNTAERLMETFWPGPLTLIFHHSGVVPSVTVAGLDTVAIRMPKHNVALALIRESGCPIAAPSANLAGRPSPTSTEHVLADLDGRIDAVLDAGPTSIGVESTVLDLTVDPPQVLRPGGTPYEALQAALGRVELSPFAVADRPLPAEKARSPGIKHKHYAPKADVVVVEGALSDVVRSIRRLAESYAERGCRIGILCTDESMDGYEADVVMSLGNRDDLAGAARSLFKLLREFDEKGVDVIVAESLPAEGLGLAVMDRLRKASGYHIIKASDS
jgi:L-threonylcarbamoyladenylate synthase